MSFLSWISLLPFAHSHLSRLLQSPHLISWSHTANPHWLFTYVSIYASTLLSPLISPSPFSPPPLSISLFSMPASPLLLCEQILTHPIYPQCMWFQRPLRVFKRFQALSSFRLVPSIEWRGSSNFQCESWVLFSCVLVSILFPYGSCLVMKMHFLIWSGSIYLTLKTVSSTGKSSYIVCTLFSYELMSLLTDSLVFEKSELMKDRAIAQHLLLFSWKCIQISWAFLLQEKNAILGYSIFC